MYEINVEYGGGTRCVWYGENQVDALKVYDFEVEAMGEGRATGGWANVPEYEKAIVLGEKEERTVKPPPEAPPPDYDERSLPFPLPRPGLRLPPDNPQQYVKKGLHIPDLFAWWPWRNRP